MTTFESVHDSRIEGKLTAFDRLIFKGYLTGLMPRGAFARFLIVQSVLFVAFPAYATQVTAQLKAHAQAVAHQAGRPYEYLQETHSAARGNSKEDKARAIAAKDGIKEGLVAVFATLESCMSFGVRGNHETHKKEVVRKGGKCLFFYYYFMDREFGLMHVRLQSWFPFNLQVYVNGRESLCRQLERCGIKFERSDNKILHVDDLKKAQQLADRFAKRKWVRVLNAFARRVNPYLKEVVNAGFGGYYWVVDQCEVATDVMFKDREALEELLPELYEGALVQFSPEDVLRFLGRKPHPALKAEITTDEKRRVEGRRIKHRMGRNSIKMYDHKNVLRIETTINQPGEFRMPQQQDTAQGSRVKWVPMRKGVANLRRYFQVASESNGRYLDAIGAITSRTPRSQAIKALDELGRPHTVQGRHVPRLQPISPNDSNLFQAVLHGEHMINGFRNRDLVKHLYPKDASSKRERSRRSARVSRHLARLRGHGLIRKVKGTHTYRITSKGVHVMATAVRVRTCDFPHQYASVAALAA